MRHSLLCISLGVSALTFCPLYADPATTDPSAEVKEKAPMYSYIANWEVHRDKFKEIESHLGRNNALLEKQIANGSIVGFGSDITIMHQEGETTHDTWWSSMSWSGLMKTLEAIKATGVSDAPVFGSGKHNDRIYVSRNYNWRPGSFTNGYTRIATWKLKSTAPGDAVSQISKNFIVPMFEKLIADGSLYEYEVDEEAVHMSDPATFMIVFVGNGPEGLDKGTAALTQASKAMPFAVSTFESWVDPAGHRDGLYMTKATYK